MTATPVEELGSIFTDPRAYADPARWHAAARRIREESPILKVVVDDYPEFWAITKHADVTEIERNPDVFTNAPLPVLSPRANVDAAAAPPVKTLIQMDGDEHKTHRNVVNDIALHFPLQVILSILGLPESDYARMLKLTQELFGAEDPDIARLGEDESMFAVILDFVSYFNALAGDRRSCPTSDLASVIANATIDGCPLADMDMLGHYLIIATAGHDTTSNAIAGGLLALMEHPDQLALLQEHPELIDGAADELIRGVSPVKHFLRNCQSPFALRDVTFQPGDRLYLSFASANRDDEVFADAMELDVRRPNAANHLAFGFGRHFCLGAHLARMEVRAMFNALLPRLEHVEPIGEPTWIRANFVQGPKRIPIAYRLR